MVPQIFHAQSLIWGNSTQLDHGIPNNYCISFCHLIAFPWRNHLTIEQCPISAS